MQRLKTDIKSKSFAQVYLLFGDEDFLRKSYRKSLVSAMIDTTDTMNFSVFTGDGIAAQQIIDLAETMPFLKEHRVILIEDSSVFSESGDSLVEYLKEPCETTIFVISQREIDKRSRLYKTCNTHNRVVEFKKPVKAREVEAHKDFIVKWAARELAGAGKRVKESTLIYLIDRAGIDMYMLSGELEKLIAYSGERPEITTADIDAICCVDVKNRIFEMVDAIGQGKREKAMSLYYDLLSLKESPLKILYLISRHFSQLLKVKELCESNIPAYMVADKAGIKFGIDKYIASTRNFDKKTLKRALNESVSMEEAVKTGRLDQNLSVELMIIKYAGMR